MATPATRLRLDAASLPLLTKAETLALLRGRLRGATVPRLVFFSVRDWRRARKPILTRVASSLCGERLAVRSSAHAEDRPTGSRAGHYPSLLDVPNDAASLSAAIDHVAAALDGDPRDQVLVQEMVRDAVASGVILTHDPKTGAPYYVIEYDDQSSRTDGVTAGLGIHKTLVVHHAVRLRHLACQRLRRLLSVTRALRRTWTASPIAIEFAEGPCGKIAVLQLRPLVSARAVARRAVATRVAATLGRLAEIVTERSRPRVDLAGTRTILGQMPDWNPAELIGASPSPLAASLFRRLITDDVWQQARAAIGYRAVPGEPLMLLLAGRPYIDVRLSFNSLLPAGLPERIATPLVDAWLQRLHDHPALHDKVEFDVAQTVMDLSFAPTYHARYGTPLRPQDFAEYAEALRRLTNRAVTIAAGGSLSRNLRIVERLGRPAPRRAVDGRTDLLRRAFRLLDACRRYGTRPFAVVARHAFIAEGILRSAVEQGALRPDRLEQFRRSLTTVVRLFVRDLASVVSGTLDPRRFLRRYGHLRPGSFDVASLRYDQRLDLFCTDGRGDARPFDVHARTFVPRRSELDALTRLIRECGLAFSAEELIRYASAAIVGRERAKFLFSRHLSDALECFAAWAARDGLTREDLAHLTLDDLRAAVGTRRRAERLGDLVAARRAETEVNRAVRLGPLIRDVHDLYVIPPLPASPTFVTTRAVTAPLRRLHRRMPTMPDVSHRVVCIESADPGFDWIFAYRIAGLITCFGGGNSHIAIRCFELGVPAAIGVGEELFERLTRAPLVELRCGERIVRSVWPDASA